MPGLDTVTDALKELGSAFLLSFFFPIVLFAAINCGLVIVLIGLEPASALAASLRLDTVGGVAVALLLQFALAWVAAPMVTALRRMIEGEMLPSWLKRPMARHAWRAAEAARGARDEAIAWLAVVKGTHTSGNETMRVAREKGRAKGTVSARQLIAALSLAVNAVARLIPSDPTPAGRRALQRRLEEMIAAAQHALEANSAGRTAGTANDRAASEKLERLHGAAIALLEASVEDANRAVEEAEGTLKGNFVRDDIRPSQLGNLRAVMERYTTQVYGVSFHYLWPRIQAVTAAEDAVAADIARSKMHIEFGVMMIAGTVATCAAWLALSFAYGAPWLFLSVGAAGPLLVGLFHRMALEGQKSLTEAVRAAIDTRRKKLLEELDVTALPKDSIAERALWRDLERWAYGEDPKVTIR